MTVIFCETVMEPFSYKFKLHVKLWKCTTLALKKSNKQTNKQTEPCIEWRYPQLKIAFICVIHTISHLVIYTACSLNIPAAVSRLTSFVIEVWPAVVGPTDEVACALGVRVTVALAHRAGRAVAALRPGRALIVGPDAVAVAPVMAVSLRAVLAG